MSKKQNTIFKTYDVRGIYPSEINESKARKIAKAIVEETKAKEVVIGRDARNSSVQLSEALIEGILEQGSDVVDIGQVSTDCLYFTLGYHGYPAGIMTTASHNPPEHNGFKIMRRQKRGILPFRGIEIGKKIENKIPSSEKRGTVQKKDIWEDYLKHVVSFVETEKIKPFRVVIDASNGMAGKVIPEIVDKIPIEIIPLNFNLDGNFPAHSPNPLKESSTEGIKNRIKEKKADFGFIFDGDADRVFLITEESDFVSADITLLLLAKYFLEKNPGDKIVYNLICSRAVPEFIKKWGGEPVRSQVGYVNIWKNMQKKEAIMGGELSGHYAFRENFYTDSGFISFLILLEIISKSEKKVSEQVNQLSPYAKSPEINFEIKDKEKTLEKIKKKYSDGKQDFLDGITVEYESWWFNTRPSHTEPLLRLTIEADNKNILREKKKELVSFIGGR